MSCGKFLLVPRDSEAQCAELRTLLLTSLTQILALWGLGSGRVCPREVRRQHSGPWSHWFCSVCPPGKLSSLRIRQVRERRQSRNYVPRTLQSIKESRDLHDQPSSSAGILSP